MSSSPPHVPPPHGDHSHAQDRDRVLQRFVDRLTDYAICMLSPEGTVLTWNAGAERFNGYARDEIIGRHFSVFYGEEDRAGGVPQNALRIALEHGKFEQEGWRVRKDGSRFWASALIDSIRDDDGSLIGFAEVTRDISARRATEQALRASEERFRLLVQGVTDYAIYMLSPSGEVTNWNAGAARIKGYAAHEVIGTHFSRFHTQEDQAAGLPARSLVIAAREGRYEHEGLRVRKDGSRFWAHVVLDPIRDDQGELIGFAKITRDVTERREAALSLERAREALFQSQKLEALGKLTGGVAHDFNNLLGVIVSGLELLARDARTPAAQKVLDSMQRAASRGAKLTQQLLAFARRQPLRQERVNLNHVILAFESVLRRACNQSIRFVMQLAPGLPDVMVDPVQFEAALLNLVTNARDAMPEGGKLVFTTGVVALQERQIGALHAGDYVVFTLRDNGSGMAPEVAASAIEPFFTTKQVGQGTGLGLSQVYGLMQQSGGDLHIDTHPGSGTAMSLYLPVAPKGERIPLISGPTAACDGHSGSGEKVLIVDDEPDVLLMAVELFRLMGYEVLSAPDGRTALEILERTPDVDVLFSDVMMPGMSGIHLAGQVRRMRPDIRILLGSGYAAPGPEEENAELRQFDFISKPYRMADIVRLLRHSA